MFAVTSFIKLFTVRFIDVFFFFLLLFYYYSLVVIIAEVEQL